MKQVQPTSVTYSIRADLIERGQCNAIERSRQMAILVVGPEPVLAEMEVTQELPSSGVTYPVLKITWKRRRNLTR